MVGMQGIVGIPEAANAQRTEVRGSKAVSLTSSSRDAVDISPAAREAAGANGLAEAVKNSGMRAERVAEAKQRIEEGAHRIQDVVQVVASRITPYVAV